MYNIFKELKCPNTRKIVYLTLHWTILQTTCLKQLVTWRKAYVDRESHTPLCSVYKLYIQYNLDFAF